MTIEAAKIFAAENYYSRPALVLSYDEHQSNQRVLVEIAPRRASYRRQIL